MRKGAGGDGSTADWRPTAQWPQLQLRAQLADKVRHFFSASGAGAALEVQTPTLSRYATTAPHLDSIGSTSGGWLRTSPEHHMKRLLASGSGDIWQLCSCFRGGEDGDWHNAEFSMLEWYRLGASLADLRRETCLLIDSLLGPADWVLGDYREFFQRHWRLDPWSDAAALFRRAAKAEGAPDFAAEAEEAAPWRDYLLDKVIRSQYRDQRLVLSHYPPDQAELSACTEGAGSLSVAQRFEVWVGGAELANGAVELLDGDEAAGRMRADNDSRVAKGLRPIAPDVWLLQALRAGLPVCAGTALGFDRVLMLAAGVSSLRAVLAFPSARA